jgi:four helix bundle protein
MVKENIIKDKSYTFALSIIDLVRKFPKQNGGFVIGNQLVRSGTSIGANVEEAIGAFSKNDFTYKMNLALKEAREAHYWLRLARDSKVVKFELESYIEKAEELRKILSSIVKASK